MSDFTDCVRAPVCAHCRAAPPAYPGARFCGAACSQQSEIDTAPADDARTNAQERAIAEAAIALNDTRLELRIAHLAIRSLLQAYAHVFECELSSTEQQIALSRARRVIRGADEREARNAAAWKAVTP